jgi:transketolase
VTDQHLNLNRPDAPRASTGIGALTPTRTWDVRQRREWEQQQKVANTPSNVALYWEQVEKRRREQEQAWEQRRIQAQADAQAREQQVVAHNTKVAAERTAKMLIASVFERLDATPREQQKVCQLIEQNNPESIHNPECYEVTLLKLRLT